MLTGRRRFLHTVCTLQDSLGWVYLDRQTLYAFVCVFADIHSLLLDAVTVCVCLTPPHLSLRDTVWVWCGDRQSQRRQYLNSASERESMCGGQSDRVSELERQSVCAHAGVWFIVTNPPLSVSQLSFWFLTFGVSEGLEVDLYYTFVCVC